MNKTSIRLGMFLIVCDKIIFCLSFKKAFRVIFWIIALVILGNFIRDGVKIYKKFYIQTLVQRKLRNYHKKKKFKNQQSFEFKKQDISFRSIIDLNFIFKKYLNKYYQN
jgi:hypothetical protein